MRTFTQKPKATQQIPSAKSTLPGRAHIGQSHEVKSILHLQHRIGNQTVQRLLQTNGEEREDSSLTSNSPLLAHDFSRLPVYENTNTIIQTKLRVNAPGDKYEQEANCLADQVMRMPEPQAQHKPGSECDRPRCREIDISQETTRLRHNSNQSDRVTGAAAPPILQNVLGMPGQPLAAPIRSFMESRFGYDFSKVRIHTEARAAASAEAIQARAYTVGDRIVFGRGYYAPQSTSGSRLLAHELVHVVQQGNAVRRFADEADAPPTQMSQNGFSSFGNPSLHPMIQRSAIWTTPAAASPDINLADVILKNPPPWEIGFTDDQPPVPDQPDLEVTIPATGGYEVSVKKMPTITNTATMHVLTNPPWTAKTIQADLIKLFPDIAQTCTDNIPVALTARGKPTTTAISNAVNLHEQSHAALIEAVFIYTFGFWDQNLQQAYDKKTTYSGPTQDDAVDALYAAMGGTPNDISVKYVTEREAVEKAFHSTPMGLPIDVSSIRFGSGSSIDTEKPTATDPNAIDCSRLTVNVIEHPDTVAHKEMQKALEKAQARALRKSQRGK